MSIADLKGRSGKATLHPSPSTVMMKLQVCGDDDDGDDVDTWRRDACTSRAHIQLFLLLSETKHFVYQP